MMTIIGLFLDMVGVVVLFLSIDKPLPNIRKPPIRAYTFKTLQSEPDKAVRRKIEDLVNDTNKAIDAVNESNRKTRGISWIGLGLILLGFLLQAIAAASYQNIQGCHDL